MRNLFFVLLLCCSSAAWALDELDKVTCPNAMIWGTSLFTNLCWSQMYPIRFAGIDLFKNIAPPDANQKPICACGADLKKGELGTVGFGLGMWRPVRIIEAVRKPWCLPSMGGVKLANTATRGDVNLTGGVLEDTTNGTRMGFYNINYYFADILSMLNLSNTPKCNPGGMVNFDLAQTSAFYPQWSSDKLASILNPEVSLLASIGLPLLQPVDAILTSTTGTAQDDMFMTAGAWGQLPPYSGMTYPSTSAPEMWLLTSTRFIGMMSRLGMVDRTVGKDALCRAQPMPFLRKTQYMFQMLHPVPQSFGGKAPSAPPHDSTNGGVQVEEFDLSDMSQRCVTAIGETTLKAMEYRMRPVTGEDGIFMLWQWVDCCAGYSL